MKGFNIIFLVLSLIFIAYSIEENPIRFYLTEKARLTKVDADGKKVSPVLKAHGTGITDGQELLVKNYLNQASSLYPNQLFANADFIQKKVEDNFSGRWAVQIFGGDPSWGRATHIRNDQWIIFFGQGPNNWDYIIWAPDC